MPGRTFQPSERLRRVPDSDSEANSPRTECYNPGHPLSDPVCGRLDLNLITFFDYFDDCFHNRNFHPDYRITWSDKFTDNVNNQPERVAVDHIDVASLTSGRGIIMTDF